MSFFALTTVEVVPPPAIVPAASIFAIATFNTDELVAFSLIKPALVRLSPIFEPWIFAFEVEFRTTVLVAPDAANVPEPATPNSVDRLE